MFVLYTGASLIGESLQYNSALTTLNLSRNKFTNGAAGVISESIRHYNTSISTLDLSW